MVRLGLTSRAQLAAENLFLRKQLALYPERRTKPRRADALTRVALVLLSQFLDWRALLTVVKPETLIRWHRQGWRLFWRWKSRPGRPTIPVDLQRLIVAFQQLPQPLTFDFSTGDLGCPVRPSLELSEGNCGPSRRDPEPRSPTCGYQKRGTPCDD